MVPSASWPREHPRPSILPPPRPIPNSAARLRLIILLGRFTRMLKYLIIAGIFGCLTLYLPWGVLALDFSALVEDAPTERRFARSLFVMWIGPLIISAICTAAAISRINTRHKLEQEKSKHLTAAGRRGCNQRAPWPPSLSLGR